MLTKADDFTPERDRSAVEGASIPIIDIAPVFGSDRSQTQGIVDAVAKACEDIGFFMIVGHNVADDAINAVMQQSDTFFLKSNNEKMRIKRPKPGVSRGYTVLQTKVWQRRWARKHRQTLWKVSELVR